MNILSDRLPDGIYIGNKFYPVHTDFKRWIKIDMLLSCDKRPQEVRFSEAIALCYKILPDKFEDAMEGVFEFLRGGFRSKTERHQKRGVPVFSFEEDAELIYAAFFAQYGLDLVKEKLHWYQFTALFKCLSEEHKFVRVMSWRSVNPADIKDSGKRAFYREMKRIYALEDCRTEEEKSADIAENMAALF